MNSQTRFFVSVSVVCVFSLLIGIVLGASSSTTFAQEAAKKKKATPTVNKKINAGRVDNFHAGAAPAPNQLLALDGESRFPLAVMPDGLQRRILGNCVPGSAVRAVNADGSVVCETLPEPGGSVTPILIPSPVPTATAVATPTANPADITGVTAGDGLTGGGNSGQVELAANFAGTGAANTVARSDHNHFAQQGWVKAMAHVELRSTNGTFFSVIGDCYNSQLAVPSSIPPCGLSVTRTNPGVYDFDPGFDASHSLILATLERIGDAIRVSHSGGKITVTIPGSDAGFFLFVY